MARGQGRGDDQCLRTCRSRAADVEGATLVGQDHELLPAALGAERPAAAHQAALVDALQEGVLGAELALDVTGCFLLAIPLEVDHSLFR
jgi:hypothetical protein